jgi:hypothetical protein
MYSGALAAAAICIFAAVGCKPKEIVITRDDSIAKEDVAIEELQEKIAERQSELDRPSGSTRSSWANIP